MRGKKGYQSSLTGNIQIHTPDGFACCAVSGVYYAVLHAASNYTMTSWVHVIFYGV